MKQSINIHTIYTFICYTKKIYIQRIKMKSALKSLLQLVIALGLVLFFVYYNSSTTSTVSSSQKPVQAKIDNKRKKQDDCDYYIHMGVLQEKAAAKAYNNADLDKTRTHLKHALNNYMSAFKPCMNTPREEEQTKSFQRVNEILKDEGLKDAARLQKFLKAASK